MVEPMTGRRRVTARITAAAIVIVGALGLVALATVAMSPPDGAASAATNAAIESAVRAAILTDQTVVVMPAEDVPGHVRAETIATLKERLARDLPAVYAGPLLAIKLERLGDYLDVTLTNPNLGQSTGAGITSLEIAGVERSGSHATVAGSYRLWLTGRHLEAGVVTPDRLEGAYSFEAGLDSVADAWRVSSWSERQLP